MKTRLNQSLKQVLGLGLAGGLACSASAIVSLPSVAGHVYVDQNCNGLFDGSDTPLAGASVTLSGTDYLGHPVNKTVSTGADGSYFISGFYPSSGTGYTLTETDGFGYAEGQVTVGTVKGNLDGALVPGQDQVNQIRLGWSEHGTNYNFGEVTGAAHLVFGKRATPSFAQPGTPVVYTYSVTNTGCAPAQNLVIVDDNGTPDYTGDDFVVTSVPFSLGAGQWTNFSVTTIPPIPMCMQVNGTNASVGVLIPDVLPNGDVHVIYRQSRSINDNVYGTPANNADGWKSHKFSDLTGSDMAEFVFTDGVGNTVLDFQLDYLSSSSSFPSGYGSLGVNGGDGKMITGNKAYVLSWNTTLAADLNQSPAFYGYTVNSPAPEASYPTWDYVDGYEVTVSHTAFGAAGFGGVSIAKVHNSPPKTSGFDATIPTPCDSCVTNTAYVGTVNGTMVQVIATAQASVCSSAGCTQLGDCTPPYPFNSSNPLTCIAFNESEVLRTNLLTVDDNCNPTKIQVFYNDEHALTLGVREVVIKTKSGKTVTDYPIAALTTSPSSVTNPAVGSTIASGDQAGVDVSGRPMFPALFITDETAGPSNPYAGDWQYGGTAIAPHAVYGSWKGAVKTVDYTASPATVTVTPDADPAKNDWSLGAGSDPVPDGLKDEGYGAEVVWDIARLGLLPGHTYRLYLMVHDGDQNKAGGDCGQACAQLTLPASGTQSVAPAASAAGAPSGTAPTQSARSAARQ